MRRAPALDRRPLARRHRAHPRPRRELRRGRRAARSRRCPTLRGRTVINLFYEASTRTQLELRAGRQAALAPTWSTSSRAGSSGRQGRVAQGHHPDALGLRPRGDRDPLAARRGGGAGRALDARRRSINAGDGKHEHPTQALLDVYTLKRRAGSLEGLRIWIVGDVTAQPRRALGHPRLLAHGLRGDGLRPADADPARDRGARLRVRTTLDELGEADVVYALRMQHERMDGSFVPSLREYAAQYQIDGRRLRPNQLLMHPGPVNRGVELAAEVIDSPQALIVEQVESGVVVRMAILYELLAGGGGARSGARTPRRDRAAARMSRRARAGPCAGAGRDRADPRRARCSTRARTSTARPTCSCATASSPRSAPELERAAGRRADRRPRACTPSRLRRPARAPAHARAARTRRTSTPAPAPRRPAASARSSRMPNTEPVVDSALDAALAARARRAPRRASRPASWPRSRAGQAGERADRDGRARARPAPPASPTTASRCARPA